MIRVFIQAVEPPVPEVPPKRPYTEKEIEDVVAALHFGKHLLETERTELERVVRARIEAFSRDDAEMGYTTLIQCEIDPTDLKPVQLKPYKLSFHEQKEAIKIVEQLLREKAVTPSKSNWSSPAFLVEKPNRPGFYRMVVDLRELNNRCLDWKLPLPAIEDLLHKLGQSDLFCVMDITRGFWNVPLTPSSRKYTAFALRNIGLFEYLVMPMGLKNAPATFVRLCELVFPREEFDVFLQVFIDDLCCHARGLPELAQRLDRVLERVIWANLKLHPQKSHLAVKEVDYLGHTIFFGGYRVSPKKAAAVRNLLPPSNLKELQAVNGMFQYFRSFIKDFSLIARPMTRMLSPAEPFLWSDKCQEAFDYLKERLCTEPILTRFRQELPCILDCDFQGQTLGVVLSQQHPGEKRERVIAYGSRSLTKPELRYTATEGELMALLYGLTNFRVYLKNGPRFLVRTDHWALKWIRKLQPTSGRLARWLFTLDQDYQFDIEHRPGRLHLVPDGLSRAPASHLSRAKIEELPGNIPDQPSGRDAV